ncbi:unnamed protein product [Ectocarpus fasciculatus]
MLSVERWFHGIETWCYLQCRKFRVSLRERWICRITTRLKQWWYAYTREKFCVFSRGKDCIFFVVHVEVSSEKKYGGTSIDHQTFVRRASHKITMCRNTGI